MNTLHPIISSLVNEIAIAGMKYMKKRNLAVTPQNIALLYSEARKGNRQAAIFYNDSKAVLAAIIQKYQIEALKSDPEGYLVLWKIEAKCHRKYVFHRMLALAKSSEITDSILN